MRDLKFHPASEIYPLLDDDSLDELIEDIREKGLLVPIERYKGQIIDGRNRYRACLVAGGTAPEDFVDVDDLVDSSGGPIEYVRSLNSKRRHLDKSQLAMVAARAREYYEREAKERQDATRKKGAEPVVENLPPRETGKARDKAGEAFGVSGKSVDAARKVREKGAPELQSAVDSGKVAVSTAAKLADLPQDEQRTAIKGGKQAVRQAAKSVPKAAPKPRAFDEAKATAALMDWVRERMSEWPPDRRKSLNHWLKQLAQESLTVTDEDREKWISHPAQAS